jgi:hypothetical protein
MEDGSEEDLDDDENGNIRENSVDDDEEDDNEEMDAVCQITRLFRNICF